MIADALAVMKLFYWLYWRFWMTLFLLSLHPVALFYTLFLEKREPEKPKNPTIRMNW